MAGRGQLPQPASPQTKQPSATSLPHTHDPKPPGSSHHDRIAPKLTNEQALTTSTVSTVSTVSAVSSGALSIRALIVGVLGGHQQPSQQPLHHTRRTQHPSRTTSRNTRKHTTFEHTYSIPTAPPPTAPHQHSQKPAQQQRKTGKPKPLPLSARPSLSVLHDAPEGTCGR